MESETASGWVRPFVTVALTFVFCYLSIIGTVGPDVFVPTYTVALVYWFKSRDDAKKAEQILAQVREAKKE